MAEFALCPTNVAFLRVQTGVFDPAIVGDKAKWYSHQLDLVSFGTWNDATASIASSCFDYKSLSSGCGGVSRTIESSDDDEDDDDENGSSDDDGARSDGSSSSSYSSLSDFVTEMVNSDVSNFISSECCVMTLVTTHE